MSGAGGSRRWVTAFVEVIEPTETSRAQAVANALVQLGANYDPILVQKDPELFQSLMSVWQVGRDDFIRPLPTPAAQDSSSAKNLLAVLVLSGAAWLALCAAALCCLFSCGAVCNLRRKWCRRSDGPSIKPDETLLWHLEGQEQKERLRTTFQERPWNNSTWNWSALAPSEPSVPAPRFGAVLPGEHSCIHSPDHQLYLVHGLEEQPEEGDEEPLPTTLLINNYMASPPEFVEETTLVSSISVGNAADAHGVLPEASGNATDVYRVVPEASGNPADAYLLVPETSGTVPESPSSTIPRLTSSTVQRSPSSSIEEPGEHGFHNSLRDLASRLPIIMPVPPAQEEERYNRQSNTAPATQVEAKRVTEPPRPPLSALSPCFRETQCEAKTESESNPNQVSVEGDTQVVHGRIHQSNSWIVRAYLQDLPESESNPNPVSVEGDIEVVHSRIHRSNSWVVRAYLQDL